MEYLFWRLIMVVGVLKSISTVETTISSTTSVGSTQRIIFSTDVTATEETCLALLEDASVPYLGIGATCDLDTSNSLRILFGGFTEAQTTQTITLDGAAFTPNIEGTLTFSTPTLPSFVLVDSAAISGYQDIAATIFAGNIHTNNQADPAMEYTWDYLTTPTEGSYPLLTSIETSTYTFKYWEMAPGPYQVKLEMSDPDNGNYYFKLESNTFSVNPSCMPNCETVGWILSNYPGNCISDCVSGHGADDTFTYETADGGSFYLFSATYLPGSKGGVDISLVPDKVNGLNSIPCGGNLKFPSIGIEMDAPGIQDSNIDLTIRAGVVSNSLIANTDYKEYWVHPSGVSGLCADERDWCTIPGGALLEDGGPYVFRSYLKMECQGGSAPIWDEVSFRAFEYEYTLPSSTLGSVQTVTLQAASYAAGGESCGELFTPQSIPHLGTGARCSLADPTTLVIKYGSLYTPGNQVIYILHSGFDPPFTGVNLLNRANLPQFTFTGVNTDTPKYQDSIATWTLTDIVNLGGATLSYAWSYESFPAGARKPDVSGITATSLSLKYFDMSPGEYKLRVRVTDPENAPYFYEGESPTFTVLQSCLGVCNRVTWTFEESPGECDTDCVSGFTPGDTFTYGTSGDGPYIVTATYLPGSLGGSNLTLLLVQYSNLPSLYAITCGEEVAFPGLVPDNSNIPVCQAATEELILTGSVTENGVGSSEYSLTWVAPGGFTDCVLGSSTCTVGVGGLPKGEDYVFKAQVRMLCEGEAPSLWKEITFQSFNYAPAISSSTLGSLQTLTFSAPLTLTAGDSCAELLTTQSLTHLGGVYSCALSTSTVLVIKYGHIGTDSTTPTIILLTSGFTTCAEGSFLRPSLPKFTMALTNGGPAYQDNIMTLTANSIVNLCDAPLEYVWSYVSVPAGSPNKPDIANLATTTTTFTFNFWELSAGDYSVKLRVNDPANVPFYFDEDSPTFTVKESCSESCEVVTWTLENDPGNCAEDCVSDFTEGDTFDFGVSGSVTPFSITATYKPGSVGGAALKIIPEKYNGLNSVPCGSNTKFPSIAVENDNIPSCQISADELVLTSTLTENSVSGSDYEISWVQPSGFTGCMIDEVTCTIPSEGLANVVDPLIFKGQLKLLCQGGSPDIWSEAVFTEFGYAPSISTSTLGSIQTITFSRTVSPQLGDSCAELLSGDSLEHLGTSYSCELESSSLLIKYGYGTTHGTNPTLELLKEGFATCTDGTFTRGVLPKFTLAYTGIDAPYYQDNSGSFTAEDIVNPGGGTLQYVWTYLSAPSTPGAFKPDISTHITNSIVLNYWEMTAGEYKINLQLSDPANYVEVPDGSNPPIITGFYYSQESPAFTVKESCSVNCATITWTLENDPGDCTSDCITGFLPGDSFTFTTPASSSPYTLTASYLPGSKGGGVLRISPDKNNALNSAPCGNTVKFPSVVVKTDAPEIQSSFSVLVLVLNLTDNGLTTPTDFTATWVQGGGYSGCADGSSSCTIPAGGLLDGGPYAFSVQLRMACLGATIWDQAAFKQFYYSSTLTVATVGSIQSLTFSGTVTAVSDACEDLITSGTLSYLGSNPECSLQDNILSIKYGSGITEEISQTITLESTAFTPNKAGSFSRPPLPRFTLVKVGGTVPVLQDNFVIITADDIVNTGGALLEYEWIYLASPPSPRYRPDLSALAKVTKTYTFNYWEMSAGTYQIRVKVTDTANDLYYYQEDSESFVILNSCSASCDIITWTLQHNPGSCIEDCVYDHVSGDTFVFATTGTTSPYTITAKYQVGSKGGLDVSIVPEKYNGLHSIPCGVEIGFPKVVILNNLIPDCPHAGSELEFKAILMSNGLTLDTDFTHHWIQPAGVDVCVDGQSICVIPTQGLTVGGPYVFQIELKVLCLSDPSILWNKVSFQAFDYSPSLGTKMIGSVQTLIFSVPVALAAPGEDSCDKLINNISLLGVGSECSFDGTDRITIKYGSGTTSILQDISLLQSGFIPCADSTFQRPPLPSFTMTLTNGGPAYQDNIMTISADSIVNEDDAPLEYVWSYVSVPAGSPNKPDIANLATTTTTFTFNFWELSAGDYSVKLRVNDPANVPFYFDEDSPTFTVKESCSESCEVVTWTLENDPGNCAEDCVSDFTEGDTFDFGVSGSVTPFSITATYKPGSVGGAALKIIPEKYNGLNSVPCGSNTKMQGISIKNNSGPYVYAANDLRLSVKLEYEEQELVTDYTQYWTQPSGFTACTNNENSCIVPAGGLSLSDAPIYSFTTYIKITCLGTNAPIWKTLTFTQFKYTNMIGTETFGSIQTITFYNGIEVVESIDNSATCNDLFTAETVGYLGTGSECSLASRTSIVIKWGSNLVEGEENALLKSDVLAPATDERLVFKPSLPRFRIAGSNTEYPGYMDHSATVFLADIVNMGEAPVEYSWTYSQSPTGTAYLIKPDLTYHATTSYVFNYWELSAGDYKIHVKVTDPNNSAYFYESDSDIFTVLESCSVDCEAVIWTLKQNPGHCTSGCITGFIPTDTFEDVVSGRDEKLYTITVRYKQGSKGGVGLRIVAEKYNGINTGECGRDAKFPYLGMQKDTPEIQSNETDLTIIGTLYAQSLAQPTQYTETWLQPHGLTTCVSDESSTCVIPANSLPIGGPYTFKIELRMLCYDPSLVWNDLEFKPFMYSATLSVSTIGSIQTIHFGSSVSASVTGDSCSQFLTAPSLPYLGLDAQCALSSNVLYLQYGSGIDHSVTEVIITLLDSGFNPITAGSFIRPPLPTFSINLTGGSTPKYQDNIATITAGNIVNTGNANLKYKWSYVSHGVQNARPDIDSLPSNILTYDFNYWEMSPGDYIVKIKVTETANAAYFYEENSPMFTILQSCQIECNIVKWKFFNDPGTCSNTCLTGFEPGDSFEFSTEGSISPYTVTASYNLGSAGGKNLTLIAAKYNNINSPRCGADLIFPSIEVSVDASSSQLSSSELTLRTIISSEGLEVNTNYKLIWEQPSGPVQHCVNNNISCTIPPGGLEGGDTIYEYKLNLHLVCGGTMSPSAWRTAVFTPFRYTASPSVQVTGGDQTYKSDTPITLSGQNSSNPNAPNTPKEGLTYKWECFPSNDRIVKGCKIADGTNLLEGTDSIYIINSNTLGEGAYYMRLIVSESEYGLSGESNFMITIILPGAGPLVSITSEMMTNNVVNPHKDAKFQIAYNESSEEVVENTYDWKLTPPVDKSISLGKYFTIKKETMLSDTEYTLRCIVSTGTGTTNILTVFYAAKEVVDGRLEGDLVTGIGFLTNFTFTALDFKPGSGEGQLKYKFYVDLRGRDTPLITSFQDSNSITTILPYGNDIDVKVSVEAEDEQKMRGSSYLIVKVTPPEEQLTTSFIQEQLSIGDIHERANSAVLYSGLSTFNKGDVDVGACGKCSPQFGECNKVTRICECQEGYAQPDCAFQSTELSGNIEVFRLTVQNIYNLMEETEIDHGLLISLLSAAVVSSEGAGMGDNAGNLICESIEERGISVLEGEEIGVEETSELLFSLISNSMDGILSENLILGESEDLVNRQNKQVDNLRNVAKKLLNHTSVGIQITPVNKPNFHLTGIVNTPDQLRGTSLQVDDAPQVTLSNDIPDNQLLYVTYMNIKSRIVPEFESKIPLTTTIYMDLADFNTGKEVVINEAKDPFVFIFTLLTSPPENYISTCVFYDTLNLEYNQKGLSKVITKDLFITCNSEHLSQFTIIPIHKVEEPEDHTTRNAIIGAAVAAFVISILIILLLIYYQRRVCFIYYIYIYI